MPYDCVNLGSYLELDCLTDKFAYNKVVSVGVIKNPTKDFASPATYNYVDATDVATDIEVIGKVIGEYDGSEPEVSTDAYGAKLEQIISRKHKLTFEVEYNDKNRNFFNGLGFAKNYGIVFVTGNNEALYFSGKVNVTFVVKTPITRELDKIRKYMVEASWSNLDLITPVAVPPAQLALLV